MPSSRDQSCSDGLWSWTHPYCTVFFYCESSVVETETELIRRSAPFSLHLRRRGIENAASVGFCGISNDLLGLEAEWRGQSSSAVDGGAATALPRPLGGGGGSSRNALFFGFFLWTQTVTVSCPPESATFCFIFHLVWPSFFVRLFVLHWWRCCSYSSSELDFYWDSFSFLTTIFFATSPFFMRTILRFAWGRRFGHDGHHIVLGFTRIWFLFFYEFWPCGVLGLTGFGVGSPHSTGFYQPRTIRF